MFRTGILTPGELHKCAMGYLGAGVSMYWEVGLMGNCINGQWGVGLMGNCINGQCEKYEDVTMVKWYIFN